MNVKIIRSNRKTLAIQINPDLSVTVRAPMYAPQSDIERILREKEGWIQKHIEKIREQEAKRKKTQGEKDEYGELQNYVVDTDPTTTTQLSAYSNYSDGTTIEYETGLRIIKYETGTEIPISGALFEVIGPDGDSVGTFVTNGDGRIEIPLKKSGNYTVVEREAPQHYMIE